jgi:hypothetical protein
MPESTATGYICQHHIRRVAMPTKVAHRSGECGPVASGSWRWPLESTDERSQRAVSLMRRAALERAKERH